MNPHRIMRRAQRALAGVACLVGGLTALSMLLSWELSTNSWTMPWESAALAAAPETDAAETSKPDAPTPSSDKPTELTVAPPKLVNTLAERPAWVEADYSQERGGIKRVVVSSDPKQDKSYADEALNEKLQQATQKFVSEHLHSKLAGRLIPVDIDTIRQELIPAGKIYDEMIEVQGLPGPMAQSHAMLEFNTRFQHEIDERWRSIQVTGRVAKIGVIAAGVLLGLTLLLGFFKADNATRGYYTTRLQVGAAGVLMALMAGGVFLFRHL